MVLLVNAVEIFVILCFSELLSGLASIGVLQFLPCLKELNFMKNMFVNANNPIKIMLFLPNKSKPYSICLVTKYCNAIQTFLGKVGFEANNLSIIFKKSELNLFWNRISTTRE